MATDTAAPDPSPEATGMVDWRYTVQAGGFEIPRVEKTLWITAASGWSGARLESSEERLIFGASILIPPREFSLTVAVACTCVTGTASAGRPYTTACSPNRMSLPGAEDVVIGLGAETIPGGDAVRPMSDRTPPVRPVPTGKWKSGRGGRRAGSLPVRRQSA